MIKYMYPLLLCTIILFPAENADTNSFNVIPRDIQNTIAQYVISQKAIDRITTDKNLNGISIHNKVKKLSYTNFDLSREQQGSLFLTEKNIDSSFSSLSSSPKKTQLFIAEGSTVFESIKSLGGITTMYKAKKQVVCANTSPNKKFVGFLVAAYNDITEDFRPVSLHLVNLLQKEEKSKELILKPFIDDCWNKNRVEINPNDSTLQKKLEEKGYVYGCNMGSKRVMNNDIISLVVGNAGQIALADQTGVMLVDMQKDCINRIMDENFSKYTFVGLNYFRMGFDDMGTNLFYTSPLANTLKSVSVSKTNNNENQLQNYFRFMGVCKNNLSIAKQEHDSQKNNGHQLKVGKPAFWKDRAYYN